MNIQKIIIIFHLKKKNLYYKKSYYKKIYIIKKNYIIKKIYIINFLIKYI